MEVKRNAEVWGATSELNFIKKKLMNQNSLAVNLGVVPKPSTTLGLLKESDSKSVWSRVGYEMQEDAKTRALDVPQKMERRKAVEGEFRWRRGVLVAQDHPTAVTQAQLESNPGVEFPWEKRQKLGVN